VRLALFSDVHANLPALAAVTARLGDEAPDVVLCLGDLVGYGPDPSETIQATRRLAERVVAGNHDLDVAADESGNGTSSSARESQCWTRARLSTEERTFLGALPHRIVDATFGFVAVHGCFLNDYHATGYVTPVMAPANLDRIRDRGEWPTVGFCGHTHVPMCAWLDGGGHRLVEANGEVKWPRAARAVLINPGAVGQPRDGDRRAAYAVIDFDRRRVAFRRVDYDVDGVGARMRAEGLAEDLVRRLTEGR
jgi:predicted phosphodiesterase